MRNYLTLVDSQIQTSYYNPPGKDATLGGLVPGDPRSELVFGTSHSKKMAQIWLRSARALSRADFHFTRDERQCSACIAENEFEGELRE